MIIGVDALLPRALLVKVKLTPSTPYCLVHPEEAT
jgi:hypothetical protein